MNDKKITGECCGRPMQYAAESKCNYNNCCMDEYCGRKLGRIKEMEPTCDSTAVIPSITVESVEGITKLANCLVHVNDINTTFYVDDKHRVMITWAGPVNISGYDMKNNPNGYRDQIVTDVENETAVIYDKHGKGYLFGITPDNLQTAINNKLDEMASDGTLENLIAEYIEDVAHVFDTVADMKASTELVNGSYARTLGFHAINDGGGATYYITGTGTANERDVISVNTTLYANLVIPSVATPEIYGAYCDGVHDDSPAIQSAINSERPVLMSKNYYTTSSVTIGNQDTALSNGYKKNMVVDGLHSVVTYTGAGSAFVIGGVEGANFKFGTIDASNGTCIEMWSTNGNVRVDYIDLSFKKLFANDKAIHIHAQQTSGGTGFINEIAVHGGTIRSGDYGIYVECMRETYSNILGMNGHHYYNVCFEGCDSNFYFNANNSCIRDVEFNGIRYEENREADLITFYGDAFRDFVFNAMFPIYEDRIVVTDAQNIYSCTFNTPISSGNLYDSPIIASGLIIQNNVKNYLNNSYNSKALAKEENINGTIELDRYMNQVVINFAGIGSTTVDAKLVDAANMPIKPIKRAICAVSSNNDTSAYVTIDTDGNITLHRKGGDNDERYWGQMTILSYSPKR